MNRIKLADAESIILGDVTPELKKAIRQVLASYKKHYGADMSDVEFIEDSTPRFNNGKKVPKELGIIPGGSWTKHKKIYLAPDLEETRVAYGVNQPYEKFVQHLIAHELAHELYHNHADANLKKQIAQEISDANFSTSYLESVPKSKKDYEAFAEYLARSVVDES